MSVSKIDNSNLIIKPYEKYGYSTLAKNNSDISIFSSKPTADTFNYSYQENDTEIINTTSLKEDLEKIKSKQRGIGKLWDCFKNLTGIGAGSDKAQEAIENYEKGLITEEEMHKAIDGYKEGQKMVVDVVADIASGILSVGAFALAVPTGGTSLGVGLALAGTVGAGAKIGIKAGDAALNEREYNGKDLLYDSATGAINGLLAPVTNGVGNTVTKTIASKIIKEGAQEVVEQGVKQSFKQVAKSVILNQADDIIGGTLGQKVIALGAGMVTDGALGGAADNMVRAGLEGENVIKAGIQGGIIGGITAGIIGGGFKVAGKAGRNIGKKLFHKTTNEIADNISIKAGKNIDFDKLSKKISDVQIEESLAKIGQSSLATDIIPNNNSIKGAIDLGLVKISANGKIDSASLQSFITTYDNACYEKLAYIFENYPNLNKASFRKLLNSYKTIDDMKLHTEDINKWLQQIPVLNDFTNTLEKEGINSTEETQKRIAEALGISTQEVSIRAKSKESIYDKLAKKVLRGEDISNIDIARTKIDDLVGTRVVLDDISQDKIDDLVANLCSSIKAKDVVVSEVHNYSNCSQKYFSDQNILDIKKACAEAGIEVKILDEEQTSVSGYVSAQMNIRYKDKMTGELSARGELQIRGELMNEYCEIEHIPYDIRQGKNIGKNNPKLEKLFEPVTIAVNKLKRNKLDNIYNDYILACYQYIRKYELGEIQGEFKLPDFPESIKDYEILSFENLDIIHQKANVIKNKTK